MNEDGLDGDTSSSTPNVFLILILIAKTSSFEGFLLCFGVPRSLFEIMMREFSKRWVYWGYIGFLFLF
ncbi:hypothetical protein RchiOBHm_Chr2g0146301 [Rosa chinensis]|uniref:Uncharacterized protein n=1 Tax=Rosa chinensis TaxID=74649 RepID=A0A2P6RYU7_ROSCH|nr:hypothetical protein RchiOBHm_Chr2g0146301 [Rosa chinensis]